MGIKDALFESAMNKAKEVASDAIENAIINAADNLDRKIYENGKEKRSRKKEERLKKAAMANKNALILYLETDRKSKRFLIYDFNKNLKYLAKHAVISAKKNITLYNSEGNRIGSVKEKLIEISGDAYSVEIGGSSVGTIKTSSLLSALKYTFKPFGYSINTDITRSHMSVYDGNDKVIDVSHHGMYDDYYIITVEKADIEQIAILIILGIWGQKIEPRNW